MASSSKQEFITQSRAKLARLPRPRHAVWDAKIASLVGKKLGFRLIEIGIRNVEIDVDEQHTRPIRHRQMVRPLFDSVRRAGVDFGGDDKLGEEIGFVDPQRAAS